MKLSPNLGAILTGVLLVACQPERVNHTPEISADASRIKSHIRFLSNDLLEGRDTGARGHEIASLYIAAEFEKYGLTPAGDNGTYMQRVNFVQAYIDQSSIKLSIKDSQGDVLLSYPKHFLTYPDPIKERTQMAGKLVFVGYGIVAPELQHNDYQDMDVKGKIVVTLSGKPKSFPSEEGAHFGSSREKLRHASDNGAVGFISISTPRAEKVRPYQNLLNFLHTPVVRWTDNDGHPSGVNPKIKGSVYLSKEASELVFTDAEQNLEQIYAMLENDESPKGFNLLMEIQLESKSTHNSITSPNVAAILEGSDPSLKNEYVVYSAHSDHIGFAKTVKKDKINNGAMDNATGTSVLMETARLFSQLDERPKRSIVFLAVTGEEKGLLGSDYYAQNPTVPLGSMVANVNLDMPILTYEFADVIAFGAEHSDMKTSVTKAAEKIGLELSPDPMPDQALFTRSDHYSFVKQGIPSVFLVPGFKSVEPKIDGSEQFNHFLKTNYHKPSDVFNQAFNWKAATKFAEVNYHIGLILANQVQRPNWNDGDFFGDTFSK
jgi:hypothetical protein